MNIVHLHVLLGNTEEVCILLEYLNEEYILLEHKNEVNIFLEYFLELLYSTYLAPCALNFFRVAANF